MRRVLFVASLVCGATALGEPAVITLQPQLVFESSNVLTMEIGGRTPGPGTPVDNGYDKLIFTSLATPQVTWGGTLNVGFINSFAPVAGDVFDLFDFDAARDAGTFATLNLPVLNLGLLWNAGDLYTDGTLRVALDPAVTGRVWDGGGANNDWSTGNNWNLNVEPLNNGTATLTFANGVRLAPRVDTAWSVGSVTFNNTAGGFTITGPQAITVGAGGIVNNSVAPQAIAASVGLGANASFGATAGDLAFGAVALGGQTLSLGGAHDITLASISGVGTVAKSGAGTLEINGAIGSGGVTLDATAGTTRLHLSQTLASLTIGAGATVVFASPLPAFAPATVPEPGTFGLMLVGALGMLRRRRGQG